MHTMNTIGAQGATQPPKLPAFVPSSPSAPLSKAGLTGGNALAWTADLDGFASKVMVTNEITLQKRLILSPIYRTVDKSVNAYWPAIYGSDRKAFARIPGTLNDALKAAIDVQSATAEPKFSTVVGSAIDGGHFIAKVINSSTPLVGKTPSWSDEDDKGGFTFPLTGWNRVRQSGTVGAQPYVNYLVTTDREKSIVVDRFVKNGDFAGREKVSTAS